MMTYIRAESSDIGTYLYHKSVRTVTEGDLYLKPKRLI